MTSYGERVSGWGCEESSKVTQGSQIRKPMAVPSSLTIAARARARVTATQERERGKVVERLLLPHEGNHGSGRRDENPLDAPALRHTEVDERQA